MRRSRRLSGLEPVAVPDIVNNPTKRAPAKKKSTGNRSSSKKENQPPSRSARKTQQKVTRTKRAASTRAVRSKKRLTPKKKDTPKQRGRSAKGRTTNGRSRSKVDDKKPKKEPSVSDDDDKSDDDVIQQEKPSIHREPDQTPSPDQKAEEPDDTKDELPIKEPSPVPAPTPIPDDQSKTTKKSRSEGEVLNFVIASIIVSVMFLYFVSFCRSMSCSVFSRIPFFGSYIVPEMLDFNMGATAVTTFVLYITSLGFWRKWVESDVDGCKVPDERTYITVHFMHGVLICVHLLCCNALTATKEQNAQCRQSMVALSIGFYGAALGMQPRVSWELFRNFVTVAYLVGTECYSKRAAFPFVLVMAVKSVVWMLGMRAMGITCSERSATIDFAASVGCTFLAVLGEQLW